MWKCKHCNLEFEDFNRCQKANHSRWCDKNSKRIEYSDALIFARTFITEESRKNANEKIKQRWKDGRYDHVQHNGFLGRTHSDETKEQMKISALNSSHRRLKKNVQWYKGIMMDSSWEIALAERLDEINVIWSRPDPIKWIDILGKIHNYFPDFYLPQFDIYLDPKNKFAFKVQSEKIEILLNTYTNLVFLTDLESIKTFKI